MVKSNLRLTALVTLVILVQVLHGCSILEGSKPDLVSEEAPPGRKYSNAEIRRMVIDTPELLSGDYFRQRSAGDTGMQADETETGAPPAAESAVPDGKDEYGFKIGILFDEKQRTKSEIGAIGSAAARSVSGNVIMVRNVSIREVLASTGCSGKKDIDCMAGHLSVFPGVRMLVIIDLLDLPQGSGNAVFRFRILDTALGYVYPQIEIADRVSDASESQRFMQYSMEQALSYARRKADILPAHGRVFSVEPDRVYISSGELTGLQPGDTFDFVPGGRTVKSPTGLPVSWIPAPSKGVLRVDFMAGEDSAACRVVDGGTPRVGDYVIFEQKE